MADRLFLCAIILLCGWSPTSACGFVNLGEDYRVALFNPYLTGNEYAPFFYSAKRFHVGTNARAGRDRLRNAASWAGELGGGVSSEEVMELLYPTSFEQWSAAAAGNRDSLFAANEMFAALEQDRPELLDYLLWAKEYEFPGMIRDTFWYDDAERAAAKEREERLYAEAREAYGRATSGTFLRRRWAYQLLLQSYYRSDRAAFDRLFYRHFAGKEDVLADWARFHRANVYPREPRSQVLLANAIRVTPEKAYAAFQRLDLAYDPKRYLPFATDDEERSDLYAVAAVRFFGKQLGNLKTAHRYDPANPLLDLILAREINKLEDWLMGYELTKQRASTAEGGDISVFDQDYRPPYSERATSVRAENRRLDYAYLNEVRAFAATYQSKNPDLTSLFRAHLALLAEDYGAAVAQLPKGKLNGAAAETQRSIIDFLATVQTPGAEATDIRRVAARQLPALERGIEPPNAAGGSSVARQLRDLVQNRRSALSRVASQQLETAGDTVGAYFLYNRSLPLDYGHSYASQYYRVIDYLDRDVSYEVLDGVMALLSEDTTSAFAGLARSGPDVDPLALHDLAGTVALRRNDLDRAEVYFAAVPERWYASNYAFSNYLVYSPFNSPLNVLDAFRGKADVVRRLKRLEAAAVRGGDAGAAANYELAEAWYNMSHYGHAWMMLNYGHSEYSDPSGPQPWPFTDGHAAIGHNETDFSVQYRGDRVELYLAKVASPGADEETRAKAALLTGLLSYRLATFPSVEGVKWYSDRSIDVDSLYRAAFSGFKDNFAATNYYKKVAGYCTHIEEL